LLCAAAPGGYHSISREAVTDSATVVEVKKLWQDFPAI
jgi:hypothetical protein